MKAMIFAAGLSTRLKPLTDQTPKALIKINAVTLLERTINKLTAAGFTDIIVNVHHYAAHVAIFLKSKKFSGINITVSDESDLLLDTGGGLKKASWFFDDGESFLVHNVDVISEIDLLDLVQTHKKNNALATLAVKQRKTDRYFLFDHENNLCGWKNIKTDKIITTRNSKDEFHALAFSGIQMISPEIFPLISEEGVFSITQPYLRLSSSHIIKAYRHDHDFWLDIGKKENLMLAEQLLKE
jgi:NDP-sugar pyrophosphorylase family protein